jgi:hypothetical protein
MDHETSKRKISELMAQQSHVKEPNMPLGRVFLRGSVDTTADVKSEEDSIDPYTNLPKGKNFTAGAAVCKTPGDSEDNES